MNLPTFPRWVVPASCVLLGLLIGWWLWHPRDAAIETHAPAIDLPGNARVIERVPAAPIPEAIPQAVEELGHGAKLERVVRLTVKPKPKATQPGAQLTTATDCTPVHIDLGLVSLPDETHRVIATTDGVLLNSPQPDALRFMPALNVTKAEIAGMIDCLDTILTRSGAARRVA